MRLDIAKDDLRAVISLVVAAAGVIAGFTFDKTLGALATAAGVIATSVFGYLKARRAEASAQRSAREVATIAAGAALETNARTVLVQTVTAERAKWRAEMRDLSSELTMLLRASGRGEEVDRRRVDLLRSGIRLRLNHVGRGPAPAGGDEHGKDRSVHADLDAVAKEEADQSSGAVADALETHMAELLKGEWDVSKDEAVTGKLKACAPTA